MPPPQTPSSTTSRESSPDQTPIQLVWLKRDLRLRDHAPLARAAANGPCLCLYVYEPELIAHPTTHRAHLQFINDSLTELAEGLRAIGGTLVTRVGDLPDVFDQLHAERPIARLWSHEETGLGITYERDKRVKRWAKARGVEWIELPNHGVFRPLKDRDGWAGRWRARMSEPITPAPERILGVQGLRSAGILSPADLGVAGEPRPQAVPAGVAAARDVLDAFLARRSRGYQGDISSPVTAWEGSSRLSPHLAWGNLSIREVYQATSARLGQLQRQRDRDARDWARSLNSFAKRLHWHCHFIQKLEDQPDIEFRNLSRACDGLRDERPDEALLDAWRHGQTGLPDGGRLHARAGGRRLDQLPHARHADELYQLPPLAALARAGAGPGAAVPGLRARHPLQPGPDAIRHHRHQRRAHLLAGEAGARPRPEGRVHPPLVPGVGAGAGRLSAATRDHAGAHAAAANCVIGQDYPAPIVDNGKAYFRAKQRMGALRGRAESRAEAKQIYRRHGSRKRTPDRPSGPARRSRAGEAG
jgi:deoxyribodipyrimidine photo-lyase